jgi:G:T/U-mismatch repair DNA glycosylase
MTEAETLQIKFEDVGAEASTISSPSFKGRLDLSDFAFNSPQTQSPRRSPRILTPKIEPFPSPAPTPTPSRKRGTDTLQVPSSASSSPHKKSRSPAGYAPPSKYAHLNELVDILEPNLICAFVGLNPGIRTATEGHAYSHPSNRFWKLLHSSGLTTRLMKPAEDRSLPALFSVGNTNIVSRPTRNGAELSKKEMDDSVQVLDEKMREFRPEAVCIVGKSIWESIWRVRHGRAIKKEEFKYGWQDGSEAIGKLTGLKEEGEDGETWKGAKVFVTTSTSGLASTPPQAEKEPTGRELGMWVEQRRIDKAAEGVAVVGGSVPEQQLPN